MIWISILLSTLILATTAVALTVFIMHGRDVKAIQCQHLHADSVEEMANSLRGVPATGYGKPVPHAYCWECGHWLTSKPYTYPRRPPMTLAVHPEGKTLK